MYIDVFGGIFLDLYKYKKGDSFKIIESIGGSGLNIALGLHILGHRVRFHGNIGDDNRGKRIIKRLKKYKLPIEDINVKKGYTGIFISKNNRVARVYRGVNNMKVNFTTYKKSNMAILTTEIGYDSICDIINNKWEKTFFDIGPRPNIIEDKNKFNDIIKIGNHVENKVIKCNIVKKGSQGARWDDYYVMGNRIKYSHTIGAGDLFDTILIHSYLAGSGREKALNNAVEVSQKSCRIKGGFESKIMALASQLT